MEQLKKLLPHPVYSTALVFLMVQFSLMLMPHTVFAGEASVITLGSNGSVKLSINRKILCKLVPTAATTGWKFFKAVKAAAPEGKTIFTLFSPPRVQGEVSMVKKDGSAEFAWTFTATDNVKFNALAVDFTSPVTALAGGSWEADDKKGTFPHKYTKSSIFGGDISSLTITAADGRTFTLSFPKPTRVGIEDGRRWGAERFQFRAGKVFGSMSTGETYKLEMTLSTPGEVTFDTDDEVIIRAGKDWVPLAPELEIKPGSALDLSVNGFVNGACGSQGRVIVTPEGHFAFADNPTKTQRFYGANLCFTSQYMPKKNVDLLLDRWLRMGYNTLRIHHYEFRLTEPIWKSGFDWDPKRIDQLCYLIAGCAKRGIWLTTDLFVSRPITPAQISVPDAKPYIRKKGWVDPKYYKALVLVHEPAYRDFLKFTEKLLNHVNPYTGKRLAEEPALAWIPTEYINAMNLCSTVQLFTGVFGKNVI